jgi:hypothetical protein
MQLLPCRRHSLDWFQSTFLSPFIQFFLTPPLKPCGFFTFLIMMQNVPFSPNLYSTVWHLFVMISMTFDWNANWPLFPSLGRRCWGWVYKNQHQNEYQTNSLSLWLFYLLDNEATRVILTQPLHHRMPVLRNVSRDLQAWTTWKLAFFFLQVDVVGDGSTKTNIKINIKS